MKVEARRARVVSLPGGHDPMVDAVSPFTAGDSMANNRMFDQIVFESHGRTAPRDFNWGDGKRSPALESRTRKSPNVLKRLITVGGLVIAFAGGVALIERASDQNKYEHAKLYELGQQDYRKIMRETGGRGLRP